MLLQRPHGPGQQYGGDCRGKGGGRRKYREDKWYWKNTVRKGLMDTDNSVVIAGGYKGDKW